MAKALGLLLVFSCGVLLGWGKARALGQQARELAQWREFLRQFRVHLAATRSSPGEIVRAIGRQTAFADSPGVQALAKAFETSSSFAWSIRRTMEGKKKPGPAEQILLPLGDAVGVKSLEEQLSALEAAELLMEREAEAARERSRQYGGLCQRLGVLLGLLAVVVLA